MSTILCVKGGVGSHTFILTKHGYFPIEIYNQKYVSIWNGKDYILTYIQSSKQDYIYKIRFSNGIQIICSEHQKWITSDHLQILTSDIYVGMILCPYTLPKLFHLKTKYSLQNPYLHGYSCRQNRNKMDSLRIKTDKSIKSYLRTEDLEKEYILLNDYCIQSVSYVPLNEFVDIQYEWLEGIKEISYEDIESAFIRHPNEEFVQQILLLLLNLGYETELMTRQSSSTEWMYEIFLSKIFQRNESRQISHLQINNISVSQIEINLMEHSLMYHCCSHHLETIIFNGIIVKK